MPETLSGVSRGFHRPGPEGFAGRVGETGAYFLQKPCPLPLPEFFSPTPWTFSGFRDDFPGMGESPKTVLLYIAENQWIVFWYAGWHYYIKSEVMKVSIPTPAKLFLLLVICLYTTASVKANNVYHVADAKKATSSAAAKRAEMRMIIATAGSIYEEMDLQDSGLSRKAFVCAWTGYYKLKKKGLLHRTGILSICDFSQSSSNQRMYVIDVRNRRLLYRTYVAHGINSGEEFANSFSNRNESCKSSLGFYITTRTYTGMNGLSLRIQ